MIKNISIVVDSIDRNEGSGAKANIALIESLASAGYNVTVYHYTRKETQLPSATCISIPETQWSLIYILSRMQRLLARSTGININLFIENMFGFSLTYFSDVKSIRKKLQQIPVAGIDLLITLSQGASFRPHYAVLQMPRLHPKWLAYVHDPYPLKYYPPPYNWMERGHRQKEKFFLDVSQNARYSAFPSVMLKEWMANYFPGFSSTAVIIPHQLGTPTHTVVNLPEYVKPDAFTILHAGSLMKQRDPFGLIKGYQQFLRNNPDAAGHSQLLLIGPADYHLRALQPFVLETPSLVLVNENVPFDSVIHMQNEASVNIVLEAESEISPFLPGKFPHCVMADKPILSLAPFHSETKRLLGAGYPYWSEQNDVQKISRILEELYLLWKENPRTLRLNRPDLTTYLSPAYLKNIIDTL